MTSGRYDLTKLDDCVRLVESTRPRKDLAAAMLVAIERTPGTPTREEVLKAMKERNENEK
jgi:hypothetical protein